MLSVLYQEVVEQNNEHLSRLHFLLRINTIFTRNVFGQYRFINIFNKLPKLTKEEESLVMFKRNLRNVQIKGAYYKIEEFIEK